MRFFLRASLLFISALLCSCFDGKEEFWLKADGSGAMEVTYDAPTVALSAAGGEKGIRDGIDAWLKNANGVRCEALEIVTVDGRVKVHARIVFDSVLKLIELSKPEKTQALPTTLTHFTGVFDFKREGRDVSLTRTTSPNKALIGGLFVTRKSMEGRRLVYVIHLPEPALESNAMRLEDGGRTLIWDYAIEDALKQPLVSSLKARIPIPAWIIASAVVVLALLVALVVTGIRRVRRRKAAMGLVA